MTSRPGEPGGPSSGDEERTVFVPSSPPPAPTPGAADQPTLVPQSSAPAPGAQHVKVGDILNHMFEVRRFIARGGMGEVFEGVNVSSDDERVAIKVMLPALSADPNVQAMFRREASTLRRLRHPALVHYLILAQEPVLKLLYIVTEFIEGPSLADVVVRGPVDAAQLRRLGIRLAEGLREAHDLGAIHRDISPDNILLENGRLDHAKIIDFGIAKDTGGKKETILGEGFAGKLNFVAPEQLGAYGREVGPWTDVYSLGLVLLAAAGGRNLDMGATLYEAVERRRDVPDVSAAPEELQGALRAMLQPDPGQRLRSMREVVAALESGDVPVSEPGAPPSPPAPPPAEPAPTIFTPSIPALAADQAGDRGKPKTVLIGAGAAALLAVVGGVFLLLGRPAAPVKAPAPPPLAGQKAGPVASADPRTIVNQALPGIACTWMEIDTLSQSGAAVSLRMKGVAQAPAQAQSAISSALRAAGMSVSDMNFDQVVPVPASLCSVLDAFQGVRTPQAVRLAVPQREFEIGTQDDGRALARVVATIDVGASGGLALFQINSQGAVSPVTLYDKPVASRAALIAFLNDPAQAGLIHKEGPTRYRAELETTDLGWSGLMMLTGREPFDVALISTPPSRRDAAWKERFAREAAAGGWQAEMVWYEVTDRQANTAPAAPGAKP